VKLFLLLPALLLSCSPARDHASPIYDPFESPALSRLWATDRFAPRAVSMQSQIVRAGHGAAKITLHSGDVFEPGIQGSKATERAELAEPERLYERENTAYEFSFSQFLPLDFPIVPTRLVLAQWKQYCNGAAPCGDDSPVVALRYVSGVLSITQNTGRHSSTLFETPADLRGHWTDYSFRLRFTPTATGLIQAWIDNRPVVDFHGPTAYPENASTGYRSPSLFYFKTGLYRDLMPEPMTLYLDEYRKRLIPSP
jgi:Polysaccharide lyase